MRSDVFTSQDLERSVIRKRKVYSSCKERAPSARPEHDGARWGRMIFHQKNTCDTHLHK